MDIREYIRAELDRSKSLQPREIAATIIDRLDNDQKAEALTAALPALVREIVVSTRPSAQRAMAEKVSDIGSSRRAPGRSWKLEHFQSGEWRRQLDAIYSTRDGNKRLADFTADDLAYLASTCRDLAAKNSAAADRWGSLEAAVRSAGVSRVADLREAALAQVMGGAA